MKKESIKNYGIFLAVIISQFITIPFFADIDKVGKLFFIIIFISFYLIFNQIFYKDFFYHIFLFFFFCCF